MGVKVASGDQQDEISKLKARIAELEAGKTNLAPIGFSRGFFGCFGVAAAVVFVIALIISIAVYTHSSSSSSTATSSAPPDTQDVSAQTQSGSGEAAMPSASTPQKTSWTYSEETDDLTGKKTKFACTTSTNEARLDFPYHNVTAKLCIRKSVKFGLDAYVALDGDGQILCSSYEGCSVRTSFDKGPIKTFSASESADHSSNIIFINGVPRLITELKKSNSVVIELKFYQAGNQDLTFKTDGLVWP